MPVVSFLSSPDHRNFYVQLTLDQGRGESDRYRSHNHAEQIRDIAKLIGIFQPRPRHHPLARDARMG